MDTYTEFELGSSDYKVSVLTTIPPFRSVVKKCLFLLEVCKIRKVLCKF